MRDLLIIGAGPGGYTAAIRAAQLGLEVSLIERNLIGGTCLNRGCIPTKTLLTTSELYAHAKQDESISFKEAGIDHQALRVRITEVAEQLRGGIEALLKANEVELIRGNGRIAAPGAVKVDTNDKTLTLKAKNIIIAVGSMPAKLPIPGANERGVYTSNTLLRAVPKTSSIVIIGGGVVGMEFASFYTQLGSRVTILEAAGQILSSMDKELARGLATTLKAQGAHIVEKAYVSEILRNDTAPETERFTVRYTRRDIACEALGEIVLMAPGRIAATDDLFLDGMKLDMQQGRFVVDENLCTAVGGIYAIGDAALAGPQLAHAATAQAIRVVSHIAGVECPINPHLVPSCVYSTPQLASVGLSLTEAKQRGMHVRSGKFLMGGNGRTVSAHLGRGFIKILADDEDRIVGAQLMCGNASDIIGELSMAIACNLTVQQALSASRPHPSFEEGIAEALEILARGTSIHALPKK